MLVQKSSFRVEHGQDYDRDQVCLGHPHICFIPFISAPLPLSTFCSTTEPVSETQGSPPPPHPDLFTTNPTLLFPTPGQTPLSPSLTSPEPRFLVRY